MKKYLIIAIACLFSCLSVFFTENGYALTNVKKVQVSKGREVKLLFDEEIQKKHVKTEYFRDIVQLSIRNASIYPAKILSVDGDDVTKVFTYQYTPDLIRCRLTVKGKAEDYRGRVSVSHNGKSLVVSILPKKVQSTQIKTTQAQVEKKVPVTAAQEKLLKKVVKGTQGSKLVSDREEKKAKEQILARKKKEKAGEKTEKALAGGQPLPSPMKVFGWLIAICGFIFAVAILIKKSKNSDGKIAFITGVLSKLNGRIKTSSFGKDKLIEVLEIHNIEPKKSIAVIRIQKKHTLVVGISNESINLISRLNSDDSGDVDLDADFFGENTSPASEGLFSSLLSSESNTPNQKEPILKNNLSGVSANQGVRQKIKERMGGLKSI